MRGVLRCSLKQSLKGRDGANVSRNFLALAFGIFSLHIKPLLLLASPYFCLQYFTAGTVGVCDDHREETSHMELTPASV